MGDRVEDLVRQLYFDPMSLQGASGTGAAPSQTTRARLVTVRFILLPTIGPLSIDVALLLPGRIHADARKLKEDTPESSTDCSKRWLCN